MSTVEELTAAIAAENERHATEMAAIRRNRESMEYLAEEQEQMLMEVLTRVMRLRVAKGDHEVAMAKGTQVDYIFDTGSSVVDAILTDVQAKLKTASILGDTLLNSMEKSARAAVTPITPDRLSELVTTDSTATRTTSIAFVTRNEIRGVRSWWSKHWKSCSACEAQRKQALQGKRLAEDKAVGMGALPDLSQNPEKTFSHVRVRLTREKSFAERMTEKVVDLARVSVLVEAQGADGGPLTEPTATAAKAQEVLNDLAQEALELVKSEALSAPWMSPSSGKSELGTAIIFFVHSLTINVTVAALPPTATPQNKCCTPLRIDVAVVIPSYMSVFSPLLELVSDPVQRKFLSDQVIKPLAAMLGDLVGMPEVVAKYTSIGVETMDAVYRLAVRHGLVDGDLPAGKTQPPKSPAAPPSVADRVYTLLHALAVFETSVEVQLAVPKVDEVKSAEEAKRAGGFLANAFLRHFSAPQPVVLPPQSDQRISDVLVAIKLAPTTFLEILNRTFSSDKRLPSTSRTTVVDLVVSPRSKISLGLKMFSELVVDVFRPYAPQCSAVILDEDGKGGRPKAGACVPRVDLPVDLVNANIEVDKAMQQYLGEIDKWTRNAAAVSEEEKKGLAIAENVVGKLSSFHLVRESKQKLDSIGLRVVEAYHGRGELLLPFGMSNSSLMEERRPLLYLCVEARHRK